MYCLIKYVNNAEKKNSAWIKANWVNLILENLHAI